MPAIEFRLGAVSVSRHGAVEKPECNCFQRTGCGNRGICGSRYDVVIVGAGGAMGSPRPLVSKKGGRNRRPQRGRPAR